MKEWRSFASDNHAGVHPAVLLAINEANFGAAPAYGDDLYTKQVEEVLREVFGKQAESYLVFNGTAANVLGLKCVTDSCHAVICPETAHINVDEGGAPEKFTGCKLITVPSVNGKLTVDSIMGKLEARGNQHHNQPRVISISQATEYGTVYTLEELREIATFAHQHDLLLHLDGARLANAAAFLGVSLAAITTEVGVDLLSFGGTKNGLLCGEAVVCLRPGLVENFKYFRKQGMQLGSKMRYLAAQFLALFKDDLWLKNAQQANQMAQLLAEQLQGIPEVRLTRPVEANAVFATIPPKYLSELQAEYCFYVWEEEISEVRLMTSFATTEAEVLEFVKFVRETLRGEK